MKKHLLPLFAVAVAVLPACTETINTHGQVILPSRLAQITPGTTTRDEVMQLLGSPSAEGTMNESRWYYISSQVGTKAFNPHDLKSRRIIIVDFDEKGVVTGLGEKTQEDAQHVPHSSKATPTHGQSMGVLDQMIENIGLGAP